MARFELDREDLLREAVALVERIELQIAGDASSTTVGFRAHGAASFYCGPDFVLQFNERRELRRAYDGQQLIKAERGELIGLTRVRDARATSLVRDPWDLHRSTEFLQRADRALDALQAAIVGRAYQVLGQVPAESNVLVRVVDWLASRPRPMTIARHPHATSSPEE